jgi:AcrR family transcriptional regulator
VSDPRLARTRAAILDAATDAMESGPLDEITISALVERAGVSRPSFYQPTVFRDAAFLRLQDRFERIQPPVFESVDAWAAFLRATVDDLLSHLHEHAVFYHRALHGPSGRELSALAVGYLSTRILEHSPLGTRIPRDAALRPEDRVAAIAAGTVWIITDWLGSDCSGPDAVGAMTDRIAALLITLSGAEPEALRP